MKEEITKLIDDMWNIRREVIRLIYEYLDGCNMRLDNAVIEYCDEDVPLAEIRGKDHVLIAEDSNEEFDYRDFDSEELVDLFFIVSSYDKGNKNRG